MPRKSTKSDVRVCSLCGVPESKPHPLSEFHGELVCGDCLRAQKKTFLSVAHEIELHEAARHGATGELLRQDREESLGPLTAISIGESAKEGPSARRVPSPKEIKAYLDQYVIGQEETKKVLAVAVHNHYKRVFLEQAGVKVDGFDDVELGKSNVMLVGPTGTGKTLLARSLATLLDVPFAIADATTITEAGYVGEDVETILLSLLRAADMDVKRAETGIVFVDEIDKIARKTGNVSITRDVSGEGVQQALLKIIEGTEAHVPPAGGRKHPEQQYINIRTKNILFICGGAFVGLDEIIGRRTKRNAFGFTVSTEGEKKNAAKVDSAVAPVRPEDLIEFGLIPEFVGRLPVVSRLHELSEDDLVRVLQEPKNAVVKQFAKQFAMEGIDLSFKPDALRAIAHEAFVRKTGARGLRAILESLMNDLMFSVGRSSDEVQGARKSLRLTAALIEAQLKGEGRLEDALV